MRIGNFFSLALVLAISLGAANAQSSLSLNFNTAIPGTIMDSAGNGTGLTDRLPGTGSDLLADDSNMALDTDAGVLTILSTDSDLNQQRNLATGEYLGTSLASLGFTGDGNNFTVRALFNNIQYAESFDQFGLYVGTDSLHVFRGGWLWDSRAFAFTTDHLGNSDFALATSGPLAPDVGDTVMLTLSRNNAHYSFTITNLTHPAKSGVIPLSQPRYLAGATNLYVGVFAANADNPIPRTLVVTDYAVTVR